MASRKTQTKRLYRTPENKCCCPCLINRSTLPTHAGYYFTRTNIISERRQKAPPPPPPPPLLYTRNDVYDFHLFPRIFSARGLDVAE